MTDYIEAATKDEWFARAMRAEERLREARGVIRDIVDALITYAPGYVHGVLLAKVVARANACLPASEPFSLVRAKEAQRGRK